MISTLKYDFICANFINSEYWYMFYNCLDAFE